MSSNYQPISLTLVISEVLEKIIRKQFPHHVQTEGCTLIVTNTMFKQKDAHKTTWTHPCSRHGHMIDFIITRCQDKMDICSTRSMRGANCGTDHQMLRSRVIFSIRTKHNQKGAMKPVKLNTGKLRNTGHAESLVQEMDNALAQSSEDNETPCWTSFQQVVYDTTKASLGKHEKKHQD